jgi:hypothetical protein
MVIHASHHGVAVNFCLYSVKNACWQSTKESLIIDAISTQIVAGTSHDRIVVGTW